MNVPLPTIHMNGTSARQLLADNADAFTQIRLALEAMARAAPNGRDYYPQGNDATKEAIRAHNKHADALRDAMCHFETIAEHVADQAV